jgi:hypothetical protein
MARVTNDDIIRGLGAIEGKFENFLEEMREQRRRDDAERENMKRDIRAADAKAQGCKDRQTWLMGVASGLGLAASAIGTLITHKILGVGNPSL